MKYATLFILILPLTFIYAQEGPAGVGGTADNGLWLKSNNLELTDGDNVSDWGDRSGNANDATQAILVNQPLYFETSAINGQPVVRLDGIDDQLIVADADILDNSAGITYYAVVRPINLSGAPRGILGKRVTFTVSVEYAYTWFFWSSNHLYHDIHTQNDRYSTDPTTFGNAQNYLLAMEFDGTQPEARRSKIRSFGEVIRVSSETSTTIPNSNQDLAIGALNVDYGTYLSADYTELIQFNRALDSIEHIFISNYLSAGYNIGIVQNDIYDMDDPANGDYDFDMAGIGRINASLLQDDARGSGIVRISGADDLNDDEYLMWGHDGARQEATELVDVPPSVEGRFERVWRVTETNGAGTPVDVGSINFFWDLNGLGPVVPSNLRLLIDLDDDGTFADETPISGAVDEGAGIYSFSGISDIIDGRRFTLASVNLMTTPLPVELVTFEVQQGALRTVDILWETASETNASHFLVERSRNGIDWNVMDSVPSAGESSIRIAYQSVDSNPFFGTSYYRLKQEDLDGKFEYSDTKSVTLDMQDNSALLIYPNPTHDLLYLQLPMKDEFSVHVYNVVGQSVTSQISIREQSNGNMIFDVEKLPEGTYFLIVGKKRGRFVKNK